jgi:hypothetical protein
MKGIILKGKAEKKSETYLGVKVVHEGDGVVHFASVQRLADVYSPFDAVEIHGRGETGFGTEVLRRGLVAFDDQIVHDEAVQVPVRWSA